MKAHKSINTDRLHTVSVKSKNHEEMLLLNGYIICIADAVE